MTVYDKHYTLCPKCSYPLSLREAVDTKLCYTESSIAELSIPYSQDPMPIQVQECSRCGYRKYVFLLGLPDDNRSYLEWADAEADVLVKGEQP